jgi:hypothetical protein
VYQHIGHDTKVNTRLEPRDPQCDQHHDDERERWTPNEGAPGVTQAGRRPRQAVAQQTLASAHGRQVDDGRPISLPARR